MAGKRKIRRKKQGGKTGRRMSQNKAAMAGISIVVTMLVAVLLVEGRSLQEKIQENSLQITTLQGDIRDEEARTEDIRDLEEYMQSDEYIEKIAKEKIGLVKDNEIIFKEVD